MCGEVTGKGGVATEKRSGGPQATLTTDSTQASSLWRGGGGSSYQGAPLDVG